MLSGRGLRGPILLQEHYEDLVFDRLGQRHARICPVIMPGRGDGYRIDDANQHGASRALLEPIVYCRFKIGGAGTIASTFALTLRVAFTCGTAPPMPADPAGVTI